MANVMIRIGTILLLAAVGTISAQDCDLVLLATRSYDKTTMNTREYFHSINALEGRTSSFAQSGGSAVLGPFALAQSALQAEKEELKQNFDVSYSRDESFEVVKMQASPQAIDAWLKCRQSRDSDQLDVVVLGDPAGTTFHGFVSWTPPARAYAARLTNLRSLSPSIDFGGVTSIPPGKTPVRFSRSSNRESIEGLVTGIFEGRAITSSFKIAAWRPHCPNPAEKACITTVAAHKDLVSGPNCANVKVASYPTDVQRGYVGWLLIEAFGKTKHCKPLPGEQLSSGARCSVEVDGKIWTATLGNISSDYPYPANISVSLDCTPADTVGPCSR